MKTASNKTLWNNRTIRAKYALIAIEHKQYSGDKELEKEGDDLYDALMNRSMDRKTMFRLAVNGIEIKEMAHAECVKYTNKRST